MNTFKLTIGMFAACFAVATVQAATSVTATNTAPDLAGVIEYYEDADNGSMGPRRQVSTNLVDRTSGQTFTITTDSSVAIDAVTLKTSSAIDFSGDADTHTFLVAILKDNNGDGKAETQIGSTYSFDLTGQNVAVASDYVTFHFDTPISNLVSGTYAFDTYFGEEHDDNNFAFRRMQGTGTYDGGGQISKASPTVFPPLDLSPSTTGNDFIFYVHGETLAYSPQYISVASTVSTNDALEWYQSPLNNSMTARRTVTQSVPNRTLGQTFTIDTDTAVDIRALTLLTWKNLDFSSDPSNHTFKIAFMKDTNNDGKTDKIEAIYTYDLTGQNVLKWNTYITFHLGTPISNLVAGTYSFELWWGEEHDLNDAGFHRSASGDYYTRGGQTSKSPATDFPNANLTANAINDLTFYIRGTEHASMPVVHTASTNAPSADVLEFFQVSSDLAGWGPTRIEEPTTNNANNRVIGQTFTLDHSGEAVINAITARQHPAWNHDLRGTTNAHTYLVAVSADTDGDGKGDAPLGTFAYDFTSEYFGMGEYVTFHLGDGISGVTAGVYQIEYYWGEVDPNNNKFAQERSAANNNYADGSEVTKFLNDGTFPILDGVNLSAVADLTFYVQGTVIIPSDPYDAWAVGFPGFTDTALASDPEGDGLNNLMEYALNGDPTADDAASVKPATSADGSWFYHVHTERVGDASLSYAVELDQNADLTSALWETNGIEWVSDSAVSGNYKSVTNRTDATDSKEFIRLQVEKN